MMPRKYFKDHLTCSTIKGLRFQCLGYNMQIKEDPYMIAEFIQSYKEYIEIHKLKYNDRRYT